ncbi:MAG TPA: hypothetical protein VF585_07975 [Chthoniobacterales bacterium]|jgi:hypothetical protein
MILHGIELQSVGPFAGKVRLGPFVSGLNVLSAPNESGKTTALRATARALFDKHTTKGDELKSLQPAGTDLSPRIAVEFETRGGRYRIEKNFLTSPRCLLHTWQDGHWAPLAEADAADRRVQELLSSTLPGRGATKPEHWGLLGFLWARQGEPSSWPTLDDEAVGQRIRARLARVEIDPTIDRLRQRLLQITDNVLTSTGQTRRTGPLFQAETELATIEASIATLRQTRLDIEDADHCFQQASAAVLQLEKEHADRTAAARELNELATAAERGQLELQARISELNAAENHLQAVARDTDLLASRQAELATVTTAVAQSDHATGEAEARLTALRQTLEQQEARRPQLENALAQLRTAQQRLHSLRRLRQSHAEVEKTNQSLEQALLATAHLQTLQDKLARLPQLNPARLRRLEELSEHVRTLTAQVQALGLTVDLTPNEHAKLTLPTPQELPAGQTTRLHSPQTLDLTLAGWGRIVIRSGATEARDLAADLQNEQFALTAALQEHAVATLDAAREAVASRKELDFEIKSATAELARRLDGHPTVDSLREAATTSRRTAESLASALSPTDEENRRSAAELDSEEARFAVAIPAAERALRLYDQQLTALRTDERTAVATLQRTTSDTVAQQARLKILQTQIEDLLLRYPSGVEPAKAHAQIAFTQAEARVATTKAALPPDFEKLPERNIRAATALAQLTNELQTRRSERDNARGKLETFGGQGLYSRETELEEKQAELLLQRNAARDLGRAARIAHDLIHHRKQAATKAVLAPLEDRLSSAFADLTGNTSRRVFLDDHLQIAGLGRTRDALYPFDNLSQGAREQLLLCLRLSVAQELATDEPQILILDDVLVNTDTVRQERILDLLGSLGSSLQILILTCHPDRYRGLGYPVTFQTPAEL